MSISDARKARAESQFALTQMSAERPLDALLPQLSEPSIPRVAVHPRVLEMRTEAGLEWVLLMWDDPGGPQALHSQLKALVEATLLAELSRSAATIRNAGDRKFVGLRLLSWADVAWETEPALRAFGFTPTAPDLSVEARAAVDAEASLTGRAGGEPRGAWRADICHHEGALGEKLEEVASMMAKRLGDDIWGRTPGGPSHLFSTYVATTFGEKIQPDLEGLRSLDMLVVQRQPDAIRWMPPLVFQAVCDFIPVAATTIYDAQVGWAESEDLGNGFAHPPLIRVGEGNDAAHIPVGHHVLRWWMMPLATGEDVPTLADWVRDQFGD